MAKKSKDKASVGGRKWALRRRAPDGVAEAEVIGVGERPVDDGDDRPLMVDLMRGGEVVATDLDLQSARGRHERSPSPSCRRGPDSSPAASPPSRRVYETRPVLSRPRTPAPRATG